MHGIWTVALEICLLAGSRAKIVWCPPIYKLMEWYIEIEISFSHFAWAHNVLHTLPISMCAIARRMMTMPFFLLGSAMILHTHAYMCLRVSLSYRRWLSITITYNSHLQFDHSQLTNGLYSLDALQKSLFFVAKDVVMVWNDFEPLFIAALCYTVLSSSNTKAAAAAATVRFHNSCNSSGL